VDIAALKYADQLLQKTVALADACSCKHTFPTGGWFHPIHVHLVDFYVLQRFGEGAYQVGPYAAHHHDENVSSYVDDEAHLLFSFPATDVVERERQSPQLPCTSLQDLMCCHDVNGIGCLLL
jgi:hypothetical protein